MTEIQRDRIRPAHPEELILLPEIERAAAGLFSLDDLPASLRNEFTPVADFERAAHAGRLLVAVDEGRDRPVGFALCSEEAGITHLEEIDVHPDHGRRGLGRALLLAVLDAARVRGSRAVTLTTFRHLPWNAPFYAQHGFRALEGDELDFQLAARLAEEVEEGLDPSKRVAMRFDFGSGLEASPTSNSLVSCGDETSKNP